MLRILERQSSQSAVSIQQWAFHTILTHIKKQRHFVLFVTASRKCLQAMKHKTTAFKAWYCYWFCFATVF